MAAPITHIVLTEKIYSKYFSNKNKKEFIVGTCIPDIRYLGVINRDKTHFENVFLKTILYKNSFDAGLLFHSLVDEIRANYMDSNNYYSLFPNSNLITQASKIFEDNVLYNKISNWKEINDYFDKIYKSERDLGIKSEDIEKWHKLLKNYFRNHENDGVIAFTTGLGFPLEKAKEIENVIRSTNTKKAKEVVLEFYNNFEKLIR
ncbi:hypothetical protein A2V55_02000 [Candidatus Woesebacteria bacterium RBG_19FT_COMBO_37_29]|uniref:Uncharacterized protein n=1 Tax=Candidatus Woesebacteria bacterium RBG_19FT_COMBO_37_29 TaxID=1802486 RepID=A0A1F7XPU0_9BACT|nr:MAG: hypothetical protein A2V55_02000 [Candidatus Woesebacteria bacterium RBG_19FT_COMBO_37_29]